MKMHREFKFTDRYQHAYYKLYKYLKNDFLRINRINLGRFYRFEKKI